MVASQIGACRSSRSVLKGEKYMGAEIRAKLARE
jgi:hypothetical protein